MADQGRLINAALAKAAIHGHASVRLWAVRSVSFSCRLASVVEAREGQPGLPMSKAIEELAYSRTAMGELSLRRRSLSSHDGDIFEIKLGDAFLMSSLFTEGEIALAELGLRSVNGTELDVVVGGLGLGYTARAALRDARVRSLLVVETMEDVIEWHRKDIVPLGKVLTADSRCRLLHGDFFAIFGVSYRSRDPHAPGRKFHAILVDIDHSPRSLLAERHGTFYEAEGQRAVATHLHPGGAFALWSNDSPDDDFLSVLQTVYEQAHAHVVTFDNPLQNRQASSTVYVARAKLELPQAHRPPA